MVVGCGLVECDFQFSSSVVGFDVVAAVGVPGDVEVHGRVADCELFEVYFGEPGGQGGMESQGVGGGVGVESE